MSAPYYSDPSVTLHLGDARDVLPTLDAGSVQCVVTSPPYFGLRDYGTPGQIGLEPSPAEYVEQLRALFGEVRRVLADDGTLWLNLGDSYYSGRGNPGPNSADEKQAARRGWVRPQDLGGVEWSSPKNLLGIPWRVAFALQDDGWTLRNAIIWHKPNAMPESVTDRLSTRYEHVFLFSRSRRYWFDLDAIREKVVTTRESAMSWDRDAKMADVPGQRAQHRPGRDTYADKPPEITATRDGRRFGGNPTSTLGGGPPESGRNPGDVWTIPTSPFPGAHFACMPLALAERCIKAGCRPGGTVLDPFSGSGTTGLAAARAGHRYVGIDNNRDYLDLSLSTRLAQPALITDEATA